MKVSPDEKITRFIRYDRHFSVVNNTVRHEAFLPHKKSVKLSVFRISFLSGNEEVWAIGQEYVQRGGAPIKARADLSVRAVYENGLEVVPDTQNHELHANITPFPAENSITDRKIRRAVARKLALVSELVLPPD